jgi:hypothetical protein
MAEDGIGRTIADAAYGDDTVGLYVIRLAKLIRRLSRKLRVRRLVDVTILITLILCVE